jgi:hypothetical protein
MRRILQPCIRRERENHEGELRRLYEDSSADSRDAVALTWAEGC